MNLSDILEMVHDLLDEEQYAGVEEAVNGANARIAEADEYKAGAEARISEYEGNEAEMGKTIQDLKARNYDLLMQIPADGGDGVVVEDVADDGTVYHIDNLFTDEDKGEPNGNENR